MKTIFIPISRGLLARNILRTGVLEKLAKENKIVIFFPNVKGIEVPKYLFDEFESEKVKIEVVETKQLNIFEKIFNKYLFNNLVLSKTTVIVYKYGHDEKRRKNIASLFLIWVIFKPLSKIKIFKLSVRYIYTYFVSHNIYKRYFDIYQPDLVFCPSLINHFDVDFLAEAKKRGIKTVSAMKGWDNVDKFLLRVEPDLFLTQNEILKRDAVRFQNFQDNKIKVVGFPQFDIYKEKDIFISKKEYCDRKNFDSSLPILFLGSEGMWSIGDEVAFKGIITLRQRGEIPNCNILIRPHFSTIKRSVYQGLDEYPNVYIDDKFRRSDYFVDGWDPDYKDMEDFSNSLYHTNIMITFASTLALDAVCFDKPIVVLAYQGRLNVNADDAKVMYDQLHFQSVVKTNALSFANNEKELVILINDYLQHPEFKKQERRELLEKLCYKVDGKSAERIADAILSII